MAEGQALRYMDMVNIRFIAFTNMADRDRWSKALPLTACYLLPLPGFESRPGQVRKLPVTWGLVVVFSGSSSFLHLLQLASHDLAAIW